MKNITRILSAALALCLLAALCLPARADGTQDCGAKLLAITFDDGPGKYTGALLDGLAERGVHATFFVNGVNASGWPETLKRIVNEGHQLANHTYNHKTLTPAPRRRSHMRSAPCRRLSPPPEATKTRISAPPTATRTKRSNPS